VIESKRRLGDFEIIRELGRGGMGIVYEARQVSLNRKIALKVLSGSLGLSSKAVVRFRREAEAAAKLHHTNIVPIYATGDEDGTHYYAMELVDGPSLNLVIHSLRSEPSASARATIQLTGEDTVTALPAWVAETMAAGAPMTTSGSSVGGESSSTLRSGAGYFDTAARMIADVADALDYAHNQGVIHRDMKPSNLLLSRDGRLSINDFGLARMLEQPGMTMTGEFVGSPLYMSPEQITAGRAPLDHRTDIYSLGATLYELLTLHPPFPGDRRDQIIGQIIHKEPKPPRAVNKKVPVDLETICLKAIEKDPDRRYQTAGQLAADLRRFVNRFAISAKRAGLWGRTTKWIRRRPAVAALLGLVLLAGAVAGLAGYQVHLSNQRMAEMRLQKAMEDALLAAWSGEFDAAERNIQEAEQLGVSHAWARMLRGQVALHQDRPAEAIQHLEQAVRLLPDSVAARAMLVRATYSDGRWDQGVMMLDELGALTPKTAEDYLFLGWARALASPHRGLDALDEAVRMRPASPIARVIRADVRSLHANDTADPMDIEAALEDARTAKGMLPDSPLALQVHLFAHLVAAGVHEERQEADKRMEALAEAERDARALERFTDLPGAHWARAMYLEQMGTQNDLLGEWRRAYQSEHPADDAFREYALALYRSGEHDQALSVLDRLAERGGGGEGELTRAYLLMFMARPDAKESALVAYRKATDRDDSSMFMLWHQTILRLSGNERAALDACPALSERFSRLPDWVLEWYQRPLDYNCDRISEEELLTAAGNSHWRQCEANFFIGIRRLAEGDRAGATEHFRRSVRTGVFIFLEYRWSRRFLARLEEDPAWPPWIPQK